MRFKGAEEKNAKGEVRNVWGKEFGVFLTAICLRFPKYDVWL